MPGSDKESGENDPAGESPKSEESDGGKGPGHILPETESEKENRVTLQSSRRRGAGKGEETLVRKCPEATRKAARKIRISGPANPDPKRKTI